MSPNRHPTSPYRITMALLAALLLASCTFDADIVDKPGIFSPSNGSTGGDTTPTITSVVTTRSDLSLLANLVATAGLGDTLAAPGPFTLFAPGDDAFARLDQQMLNALSGDLEALTELLNFHVVVGRFSAADLASRGSLVTVLGEPLTVVVSGDNVTIEGAKVMVADLEASNGVVHIIDAVLIPPDDTPMPMPSIAKVLDTRGNFTTLLAAATAAGLAETLDTGGPFTLFAPTDAAFLTLPEEALTALLEEPEGELRDILLYHLLDGTRAASELSDGQTLTTLQGDTLTVTVNAAGVFINDTIQVEIVDIPASNGVIHAINAVLTIPEEEPPTLDVVLADWGGFDTLLGAVETAGLTDTLREPGPFTLFAPTDAAFDALGEDALSGLSAEELGAILAYHLVPGERVAEELGDDQRLTTAQGLDVTITRGGGGTVFVNGILLTITNIPASNGVIHAINAVLTIPEDPPGPITAILAEQGNFTTLLAALDAAGLTATLSEPGPFTLFAPTDAAFDALPPGALDALLMAPDTDLFNLLLYHLVSGIWLEADLSNGQMLPTSVLGEDLAITKGGGVFINGSVRVETADILAGNGVIHAIDDVLTLDTEVPCQEDAFAGNHTLNDYQLITLGESYTNLAVCPGTPDWFCLINLPIGDYTISITTDLDPNDPEGSDLDVEGYFPGGNPLSVYGVLGTDTGVTGATNLDVTTLSAALCIQVYGHTEASTNSYNITVLDQ